MTGEPEQLAMSLLSGLEPRRSHVRGVGRLAERLHLERPDIVSVDVVAAAWLHDVGYASTVQETGFHPVDGAAYLRKRGWSASICALVAFHTGSSFEARERGLSHLLNPFRAPVAISLDALNYLDLSIGPNGDPIEPNDRIVEILNRYGPTDPVHSAVTRSRVPLMASVARIKALLLAE